MVAIKKLALNDDAVLLISVGHGPSFRDLLNFCHDLFLSEPNLLNWPAIFDLRHWDGLIYDDDQKTHLEWLTSLKKHYGLNPDLSPDFVWLIRPNSAVDSPELRFKFVTDRAQEIGRTILFRGDPKSAWAHIRPGRPPPAKALKFLDNCWF